MPPCRRAAGAGDADADANVAARGAREELANADEIGVGLLVEPPASLDILHTKIAEMGNWAAKRREPEPQRGEEHFCGNSRSRIAE